MAYTQPANPAPVSGPGALSQRTDGGAVEGMTQPAQAYTGGTYGSNKSTMDQQTAAPLAGNPSPMSQMDFSLTAPTAYSDEPLSAGANYGEGPGLDTSGIQNIGQPDIRNIVYRAMQFDSTGELEAIYNRLNN
jgi:hypothetical protein